MVHEYELIQYMKPTAETGVKSADRALDILEYVAAASEPPGFSQLLSDLAIPRSSLFHLLNNLLARGYLQQDGAGGRYRLGQRIQRLAARMQGPPLAAVVMPHLRRLSDELNETSGFNIWVEDTVEVVATATGHQALAYTMKVGERAPLYAISAGKIVLARMTATAFDAYLERTRFARITDRTLKSKEQLRKEIAAAKKEGFAYSREEFTPGITGIATAVIHDGHFLGALNLAVPTARFTAMQEAIFRRELRSTASALGQSLRTDYLRTAERAKRPAAK